MLKLFINNNPNCMCHLENIVKEEIWELENKPFLIVSGNNINLKSTSIEIFQDNNKLFSGYIEIDKNSFSIKIYLKERLQHTNNIKIILDNYEEVFNIKLNKLYGFVKYKDKTPVRNAVISCTGSEIVVLSDENGYFELYLSDKVDSIGIFDKEYSKETLEVWLYNIDLYDDLKIDTIMDRGEVYNIRVWNQEYSTYIHFIPMSMTRVNKIAEKTCKKESELILDKDIWPQLRNEDVEVSCNDKKLEILAFGKIKDFLARINENNIYRNGYIVCVEKLDENNHNLIKIRFKDKFILDEKITIDFGEGYYLY